MVTNAALAAALPSNGSQTEDDQYRRELHSLNVAITTNALLFVAKVWVYIITGSSSILAEALHSVADVMNQALLRIGVVQSMRSPTMQYPYG